MTEHERQLTIRRKLAALPLTVSSNFITTGFPPFDRLLPRGRIVELFGEPSTGKTTLALHLAAGAQRSGLSAAWIDAEQTLDPSRAASLGVAIDRMPIARPSNAEEAFEIARQLANSRCIDLLIIDSAAALVPHLEMEIGLGDSGLGLQARALVSGMRRLAQTIAKTETSLLVLNQIRGVGGSSGMKRETSAGGPALKLYSAVRVVLEPAGAGSMHLRAIKNKSGEACIEGKFRLENGLIFTKSP